MSNKRKSFFIPTKSYDKEFERLMIKNQTDFEQQYEDLVDYNPLNNHNLLGDD